MMMTKTTKTKPKNDSRWFIDKILFIDANLRQKLLMKKQNETGY